MDHNVTIGAKVKAFRTAKKYTLKQLSEESGLSIGFLSQLERGLSSIAIDSLAKLATILGVSLSSFFDSSADQEKSPVSRSFAMHCSQINPQIVQYLVNGNAQGFACLPRIFHLMPSATTSSENQLEMNQHDGEEFIYVLEGILTVYLDGSEYCLNPGDSIQIHSQTPHDWVNNTNRVVKILTVHTPMEAIRTATYNAASVLGIENETGSLKEGLAGDLLIVKGDVSKNIRALDDVQEVYLAGEIVYTV